MSDTHPNRTTPPDSTTNATFVTPPGEQARLATEPGRVVVPGFEIESTLGRGAFGVVYQARQVGLNRAVALKMLIAGPYASPATRTRFLLEAESVAALEHPHIVRVFAFGECDGHPYLAMEFLSGGTLAERIKLNGPLSAEGATELVAKLAAAVAHAHSRGVVHRDIKPGNVLLTADGEPRLADFGLAKVGRSDLTVTGQVLGTPAYVAPEQAAGKVHEVGTAADVYALGAVLYDALTGRPPFTGDSAAGTLQKVLSEEPARPRKLNASIPADLETICLKCLDKNPAGRYPTAQALADDLVRYLRNEPISVRPAGALERGFKWVKRNKVVAGAIAAVALALAVGAGVSLAFGLQAQRKQKDADDAAAREKVEAARADRERDAAVAARNDVEQKNAVLAKAQKEIKRNLAKALLGPIGLTPTTFGRTPARGLTPYEQDVLWQIAELRRDDVSVMFLEEATRTAPAAKQVEPHAGYAFHAAIGLDLVRRDGADRLVRSRLQEPDARGDKRVSLALVSSRSGFLSPETAQVAARALADALAGDKKRIALDRRALAEGVAAVAKWMEPAEAAKVCSATARALTDALAGETNLMARYFLADGVAAVAEWMEPAEAAKWCSAVARALTDAAAKETNSAGRSLWLSRLAAVAEWMEPSEAAKWCSAAARTLADALGKRPPFFSLPQEAEALAAVAEWMEPSEAAKVCSAAARTLADALAKEKTVYDRGYVARGLVALVKWVEPAEAAKVSAAAARALTEAVLGDIVFPSDLYAWGEWLEPLLARMDPSEATRVRSNAVRIITAGLARSTYPEGRQAMARGLAAVAVRMDPSEAVRTLTDLLAEETDSLVRDDLAAGLSAVAARMEPSAAARMLAGGLAKALGSTAERESEAQATPLESHRYTQVICLRTFTVPHNLLHALPLLHPAFHPQPRPVPPQELVELLKHPFCVGGTRRAVLDALEFTCNRRFKDHWEFVEYAQKHQPQLDLLTPPKRSEPKP